MNFLITLSNLIIPFLLLYIISYGLMGKREVYSLRYLRLLGNW